MMLGAVAIFVYVGAEVSIGSGMANYLMLPTTLHLPLQEAGRMVAWYWGLAMTGRFIGSYVLRVVNPGYVLMMAAGGAIALALVSSVSTGAVAGYTLIAVGLCNSIMFPTIFALATEGLVGEDAPKASGIICVAIFGGAVVPLFYGFAADLVGLALALLVPVVCYAWIAFYGYSARRPAVTPITAS